MRGQQLRQIKINEKIELSKKEENQLIDMIGPSFKKKAYSNDIGLSPFHRTAVANSPYNDQFSIVCSGRSSLTKEQVCFESYVYNKITEEDCVSELTSFNDYNANVELQQD